MVHNSLSLQAAFGYLFKSEVAALKELARSLPDNPFVINIGAGSGTSGLTLLESRPDLYLITIDIQKEDSPYGCLYAEEMVLREAGLYHRCTQLHGDSKAFGQAWTGIVNLDGIRSYPDPAMIFVDGDHSYLGAKGDILSWLPNIKPGGIMAVHDFNKREVFKAGPIEGAPHPLPWPGVDRAVRKFLCPKYEIILQVETLIAFRIGKYCPGCERWLTKEEWGDMDDSICQGCAWDALETESYGESLNAD